jgi:hypothetical protein
VPCIWGDHVRLVIWVAAVYAKAGSVIIRFFSGRGELSRALALRGEVAP